MQARWDGFEFDTRTRRLTGPDGEIHVEPQVFDVLAVLIAERDRVVTKEEILDAVWGDQFVSESALTTRIKDARRAVGDDGRTQRYIRNSHGHGYRFVGEVAPASVPSGCVAAANSLAREITVDDEFPFVGRLAEMAEAMQVLSTADRRAVQLFIGGVAGAGKSRFAVQVLQELQRDGRIVCAGRCEEQVTSALQPLRDAIAQLAAQHPAQIADWGRGVEGPLVSMIPSLAGFLPFDPVPVDAYAGIDVFLSVFDRVADEAPLVLLIDDVQWSDEPTRGLLSRVQRRLADRPVATVHTFRSSRGDLPGEVDRWIREQSRAESVARFDLDGLASDDAEHLIRSVLGHAADAASVIETTEGHCLFLTESLRDLQHGAETSRSVTELVSTRVERQPEPVRRIIQAGALLGPEFAFSVAADAADLAPVDALASIADAIDADLLHETASPERFRFSHQLVPEAIVGAMGRQERALAHARCAEALDTAGAAATEVARHRLGAVPLVSLDRSVAEARSAAASAVEAAQFDRAIRLLARVLEVGLQTRARAEVLLAIGQATVDRGNCGEGVKFFEEAADLARRNGWPDLFADAALGHWGRSPFRRLSDRSTLALLDEADAMLGPEPSVRKARVQAKRAAFSLFSTRLSGRRRMLDRALALAPGAEGDDLMELLESEAVIFSCPAGVDELDRIDPQIEALRNARASYFADAAAPETRLLMRGRGRELRAVLAVDETRTRSQPITEWRNAVTDSTIATFEGRFDAAYAHCDEGGAIGEPYWGESTVALHAMGLLFVDAVSGRWERAVDALAPLAAGGQVQVMVPALAWAAAGAGDLDRARTVLAGFRPRNLGWFGEHILGGNSLIAAGEAALLVDDEPLIHAARVQLEPFAELVLGVPWACSFAAGDTLSRLAVRQGDEAAAEEFRTTARSRYESLVAPALLARIDAA
jgi:DNA-binding winged helix-turn-helix (wHTH) protein